MIPRSFNDAQQIADRFKDSMPVILNLQGADQELSKRLIDFTSGLTYALDGGMQRVADKVFLLTPRNVRGLRRRAPAADRAAASSTRPRQTPGIGPHEPNSLLMTTLALLADAASSVNTFIDVFIYVYVLLIFVYILTSWVRLPYSPWLRRLSDFLRDVCEPYLRLFRRILPPLGPLDLSPVVAIVLLFPLKDVIDRLFDQFS